MNRHHAHLGDHLVMALAGAVVVVIASIFWSGLVRLLGGAS